MNDEPTIYLSTRQVAGILRISVRGLVRLRELGEGPLCHLIGRHYHYSKAALEDWELAQRRLSTADDGTASRYLERRK